jgi:Na+/H+-dicarboxylate symporter
VWFVTAAVVCIILAVASPPVPGGMTASFTILFTQLALPISDLAVILSLTSVLDFVVTAANVFSGQCVIGISYNRVEKKAIVNDE